MDSEMPYFLVWSLSSSAWCIMRYTVYPCLVSCPFYAIPINYTLSNLGHFLFTRLLSLNLARACAAKGDCSLSVGLSAHFLSNRGCCRYQTWICGYLQRALGTARVWSGVVQCLRRGPKIVYSSVSIILGVH